MGTGYGLFFREFIRNFHTTGSLAPSSRWLARALTRHVPSESSAPARRILEVGPGTGAVTDQLVRRLAPQDSLTLVELNESFVTHMRQRFHHEPHFRNVAPRTDIIHDRFENVPADQPFDVIVSGLPLNNFSVSVVEQILTSFERLLAPSGTLSFFEYMAVRVARGVVSRGAERLRIQGISQALQSVFTRPHYRRQWVWRNIPPAWVHHVSQTASPANADD